jgi:DNA-binding SARP family transcriptional activator
MAAMDRPATTIRIELLGAPRVVKDGAAQRLPIRKSIALLALLALEGRCTRAKLATLLWDSLDDDAARRNLRRELHRLREAGLHDVLATGDDQVALAPGVHSDAAEFAAALARDDLEAAAQLHAAPLLDGFDLGESEVFNDWLAQTRDRLARQWQQAADAQAARFEAAGDARAALALRERLVAHDPLQESQVVHAMRLLATLGERAAALDRFERLRVTLRRELGLDPLPETAAFAERVRAAEQLAPLVARSGAGGLARFEPPLIARAAELQRVRSAVAPLVLIVGEPGVGKTRLADAATADATPRTVLRLDALARGAPLQAFAAALRRALVDGSVRARVDALPAATRRELARLLPEMAGAAGTSDDAASPALRSRFFDALADAWHAALGAGAAWIDDVHWADDATLELIELLVHRAGRARSSDARVAGAQPARLVATARRDELADHAAARDTLRRLERAGLVERIELQPFDADATLQLVRTLSGSAQGARFAERLQRTTHGNPYFLLETLRFLFDSGELAIDGHGVWTTRYDDDTADYAELPVPPTVQQAIVERVERLGPAAQRVLESAALADDPFTLDDVQGATALSEWEAVDGLERAALAQVLAAAGAPTAARNAYRFAHQLARQALEQRLGPERRRLIHRRLAASIEARHGRPDRIAHHLQSAGDGAAAAPWWRAAARAAERVFAWREALAHHAAALAADPDPARRADAHRARYALHVHLYASSDILAEADALQALAGRQHDDLLALESHLWRIRAHNLAERFAPAVEAANAARALAQRVTLPPALRHEMHMAIAQTRHGSGDIAAAAALLDAEAAALHTLDAPQRLELHLQRASLAMTRGDLELAHADATAALQLAQALHRVESQGQAANVMAYVLHVRSDTAGALRTLDDAQAQAERAMLVSVQRSLLTNLVKLHVLLGRGEPARVRLQQAFALLGDSSDLATQARLKSREVEVCGLNGDIGGALRAARGAVDALQRIGSAAGTFWPWYQWARLLWQCGDSPAALAVYRALPRSSAWSALAQPALDFFGVALRLPAAPTGAAPDLAAPADVARDLAALPAAGVHSHYDERDRDYWRASALLMTGDARAAWALAEPLQPPPFTLHPAAVLALRLRCALAAGADTQPLIDAAHAALPGSLPLESIELHGALAAALSACGRAAEAASLREAAHARAATLAATLDDEPALRGRFVARHAALIG